MKILAIEDNVAFQDILVDILTSKGHTVKIASSIDDAINEIDDFSPETVFMETEVNGEDSSQILVRVREKNNNASLNVILIKGIGAEVPTDNPFIKTVINKPFKSEDVLNALEIANGFLKVDSPKKEPKIMLRGAFQKIRTVSGKMTPTLSNVGTKRTASSADATMYGTSYVTFEQAPEKAYKLIRKFLSPEYSVLVVSSDNIKAVKQKIGKDDIEVITLTSNKKGNTMDINALGSLFVVIKEFGTNHDKPVILIDDLTNIIDSNGLNQSLVFIHQLVKDIQTDSDKTVAVSVDPAVLTIKDRNILLGEMSEYKE